jgi:tetratricopeptide (TPR) repeat protein
MKQLILSLLLFATLGSATLFSQTSTEEVLAFQQSYSLEDSEDFIGALKALENVQNESYALVLRKAWLNYEMSDFGKSEALYRKAIELEPNSLTARFGLVLPLSAMERYQDANLVYQDILKIDPLNPKAAYWLAYSYYLQKEYKKAAELLSTMLKHYPFDYDANLLYGEIALIQGKIELARTHYLNALRYNPSNSDLQSALEKL